MEALIDTAQRAKRMDKFGPADWDEMMRGGLRRTMPIVLRRSRTARRMQCLRQCRAGTLIPRLVMSENAASTANHRGEAAQGPLDSKPFHSSNAVCSPPLVFSSLEAPL
jgi:hypothetical protein